MTKEEIAKMVAEQVAQAMKDEPAPAPAKTEPVKALVESVEKDSTPVTGRPAYERVREEEAKRTERSAPRLGAFTLAWLAAGGAKGMVHRETFIQRLKDFGLGDVVAKGLQESVFAAGGSAVPVEFSNEWIEFLRPQLVLSQLGVQSTTFKGEKVIGRQDSGATAYWVDEGVALTKSTPSTGQLKLKARKLGVLCDCSNDIIRNPAAGFDDANLTADMAAAARTEFENQSINGLGSENKPKGIITMIDSSQKYNKAGTSIANYIADVDKLVLAVDKTNRPRQSRGFLMSPDLETTLLGLVHTNGSWVFRDDMLQRKMLRGMPYVTSTLVPTTHLIHGEWADMVQGFDTDATLESSNAPRFAEDETTFRLVMRGDVQVKRAKSFAAIVNY